MVDVVVLKYGPTDPRFVGKHSGGLDNHLFRNMGLLCENMRKIGGLRRMKNSTGKRSPVHPHRAVVTLAPCCGMLTMGKSDEQIDINKSHKHTGIS